MTLSPRLKRLSIAVITGIVTAFISSAICVLLLFRIMSLFFSVIPSEREEAITQGSTFLFMYASVSVFFTYIPFLLAGIPAGWIMQKRGWLTGALLGFFLPIAAFILLIIGMGISDAYLNMPVSIGLAALGGWIGEHLYKKSVSKESEIKTKQKLVLLIFKIGIICVIVVFLLNLLRSGFLFLADMYDIGLNHIDSMSEERGQNTATITLHGSLFTRTGNVIVFVLKDPSTGKSMKLYGERVSSADGRTLIFSLSQELSTCTPYTWVCASPGISLPEGEIAVSVFNMYGKSNSIRVQNYEKEKTFLIPGPNSLFQQILSTHCIGSQILPSALPIRIDISAIQQRIQIDQNIAAPLHCVLDAKLHTGYVTLTQNGMDVISIYDQYSPEPPCLICQALHYPIIPSESLLDLSTQTGYNIFGPMKDEAFSPEESDINILGTKEMYLTNNEIVSVSYNRLVLQQDERLTAVMREYSTVDPNSAKTIVDRQKHQLYTHEIKSTFFQDLHSIHEPEKSGIQDIQTILSSFSPRLK